MYKNKIIIILAVFLVVFLGFYIFLWSYSPKNKTFDLKIEKTDDNSENTNNGGNASQDYARDTAAENAPSIEVKPADCDNNCARFKKDNEKEYCQEICGTKTFFEDAEESGGSSGDCASEKGVQKDYCLKDIAVGNKDFKTCDEIKDENIKKSCRNRIMEDLLESQQNSSDLGAD